jgi:hypothetical protein
MLHVTHLRTAVPARGVPLIEREKQLIKIGLESRERGGFRRLTGKLLNLGQQLIEDGVLMNPEVKQDFVFWYNFVRSVVEDPSRAGPKGPNEEWLNNLYFAEKAVIAGKPHVSWL